MSGLEEFELEIERDAYVRQPLWILGPRSYFSDRAVPLGDIIAVPARSFDSSFLRLSGTKIATATRRYHRRIEKLLRPKQSQQEIEGEVGRYHVDLRVFGLGNWSHFLNKALPIAILVRDQLAHLNQKAPIFILDEAVFKAITDVMERFGLSFIRTNAAVKAALVQIDFSTPEIIDHLSRSILEPLSSEVDEMINGVTAPPCDAIFLNRRPPLRSLINSDEIKERLVSEGYVEVFMEDHSAEEQIALILRASRIVAIHGAALAPLIFRTKGHGRLELIELVPPGHVVPFFRDMISDLPCFYRMVRGIPDASMTADAFANVDTPSMQFTQAHSLKPFAVDPASLQFAMDSVEDDNFPYGTINSPS